MADTKDSCVPLVQRVNDHIELRDQSLGDKSPVLAASPEEWKDFLASVEDGTPSAGAVRARTAQDGVTTIWRVDASEEPLTLTASSWTQFEEHVKRGDYAIEKLPRQAADTSA
ncbi:hypothetical protein [Nonomuraea basaltis]|uniref:hypothetical protein n=1 Tax=Nonomuraea basaltis TaxID=2495887 RepID=UPI00197DE531|nr:hypothetical protein [Nonomuraea basaltis]